MRSYSYQSGGYGSSDARAVCWCGEDEQLAVDGTDAVTHIGEAAVRIVRASEVKTRTAVADFKAQTPRARIEVDRNSALWTRVLGRVLESLKTGEVDRCLKVGVVAGEILRVHACASGSLGEAGPQGTRQALLLEQRRIGMLDQPAKLIECLLCLLGKLIKHMRLNVRLLGDTFCREAEVDAQRYEALLRAVVQVALQPTTLLLDGLHGAPTRGSELTQRRVTVSLQASVEIGEVAGGVIADARKQSLHGAAAESATRETVKPRSWWGRESDGHARRE
jgi:hypothetical protein